MLKIGVIFLLMLPGLLPGKTDADRYAGDYGRILNAYKSHTNMTFEVSYMSIGGSTSSVPANVVKYYFKGNRFYYNAGSMEVLKNEQYIIGIDNQRKTIVINNSGGFKDDFLPISALDTFLHDSKVIINYSEKENGRQGCYSLDISGSKQAFSKMEMVFEKSSYLLDRIKIYVAPDKLKYLYSEENGKSTNKPMAIEYAFSNYRFSNIDDDFLAISRFVTETGGKFKGNGKYAKYKVIVLFPNDRQGK